MSWCCRRQNTCTAQKRRGAVRLSKKLFGLFRQPENFFDFIEKVSDCTRKGGSPGLRWLRPKASGLPPAVQTPFHTIPPVLLHRGPTSSTGWDGLSPAMPGLQIPKNMARLQAAVAASAPAAAQAGGGTARSRRPAPVFPRR